MFTVGTREVSVSKKKKLVKQHELKKQNQKQVESVRGQKRCKKKTNHTPTNWKVKAHRL